MLCGPRVRRRPEGQYNLLLKKINNSVKLTPKKTIDFEFIELSIYTLVASDSHTTSLKSTRSKSLHFVKFLDILK